MLSKLHRTFSLLRGVSVTTGKLR